ncbi:hypothetical protein [Nonomuraea basaltis]|uniref:hypothetical protein n=1 Tax=Nonomuraea basaltis TaxID=2495887 RepID=UPI00197EB1DF|nr:hypothetical protein [Nonomuraea basaltis]
MNVATPTQDQIVARIREIEQDDFFGFRREVLVMALDFEHARAFLVGDATDDTWEPPTAAKTGQDAKEYYDFALGKIRHHRGLSAERSVDKLGEYAWLLGRDDVVAAMKAQPYCQYGAPIVKAFADGFGLAWPDEPEVNRMVAGEPCEDGCERGCER